MGICSRKCGEMVKNGLFYVVFLNGFAGIAPRKMWEDSPQI
jgi:hypothetical protein